MKKNASLLLFLILTIISTLLAGCSTPTPQPTPDQAAVVAAAVGTISAQMTDEAIRNPSPTPFPTQTPIPPTATPLPPTETPALTLEPTQTATQAAALSASLKYITTFPENKRVYIPNEWYGLALGFENTGTITWEAGSYVELVSFVGEVTVQTKLSIDKEVKPGERAEYALWAFGSETLGQHTFNFQLYTKAGIGIPGGYAVHTYTSV